MLAEVTHALVGLASMGVRFLRTRRRELPDGIWIASDQDLEAIGDPLARIAARHSPLEGGDTGDIIDGMLVVMGTGGYALTNARAEAAQPPMLDLTPPADGE